MSWGNRISSLLLCNEPFQNQSNNPLICPQMYRVLLPLAWWSYWWTKWYWLSYFLRVGPEAQSTIFTIITWVKQLQWEDSKNELRNNPQSVKNHWCHHFKDLLMCVRVQCPWKPGEDNGSPKWELQAAVIPQWIWSVSGISWRKFGLLLILMTRIERSHAYRRYISPINILLYIQILYI